MMQISHLHFLKSSSTKIISTSIGKICFSNILREIVSRLEIIIPPPLFLSDLRGLEKLSIKNRDFKKTFHQALFQLQQECLNTSARSLSTVRIYF